MGNHHHLRPSQNAPGACIASLKGTLASANEALRHECSTARVGADGGRDWPLDGLAQCSSLPLRDTRAEHPVLRSAGSTTNIRSVGVRLVRRRGCRGASARRGRCDATTSLKLSPLPGARGTFTDARLEKRALRWSACQKSEFAFVGLTYPNIGVPRVRRQRPFRNAILVKATPVVMTASAQKRTTNRNGS